MAEDTYGYAKLLPEQPPEGLLPWLIERGALDAELLIYKKVPLKDPLTGQSQKYVQLKCSACMAEVYTDPYDFDNAGCGHSHPPAPFGFFHPVSTSGEWHFEGHSCLCPECGAPVKAMYSGSIGKNGYKARQVFAMSIERLVDGSIALLGCSATKTIYSDGRTVYTVQQYEAYVVLQNKMLLYSHYKTFFTNPRFIKEWTLIKMYRDRWFDSDYFYPFDPSILEGSTAENSKLDIFLERAGTKSVYPVSYLRLWQKRPQVENLVVNGLAYLVNEMLSIEIYTANNNYASPKLPLFNWKERSPQKMLGLTKPQLKKIIRYKWDFVKTELYVNEIRRGRELIADDFKLADYLGLYRRERLHELGIDWLRAVKYVKKQALKDKRSDVGIYMDYLRIAGGIGEDTALPAVQFPPNLMRAHDRVEAVRRQNEAEKAKAEAAASAAAFAPVLAELEALSWEHGGILIRPARDSVELSAEGKALNHCVGSYANKHYEGREPIFFVRRSDAPDEPWYTLQLDISKMKVIQNRGKRNGARTDEVAAFEAAWLEHLHELRDCRKPAKPHKSRKTAKIENLQLAEAC